MLPKNVYILFFLLCARFVATAGISCHQTNKWETQPLGVYCATHPLILQSDIEISTEERAFGSYGKWKLIQVPLPPLF